MPFPIQVGLDISSLNQSQVSGVGRYTIELAQALKQIKDIQLIPFWRISRWKYRKHFRAHMSESKAWWPGLGLGAQVVHGPDFRVAKCRQQRVVTIHDLAFLEEGMTSKDFSRKKKKDLDRLLDQDPPDAIIVDSLATERDLLAYRPGLSERISVVYLGGDHLRSGPVVLNDDSRGDYFLFVGNLEARKNVLGIIRAFEIQARENQSVRLVLVGKPGFQGAEILRAAEQSPVRERIQVVGYCSSEDLRNYYRRAIALVYPSWIEGFGLPVLEAMLQGCPVITSQSTSTAEIAGSAAWLVDPSNTISIAQAMADILSLDPDQRAAKIRAAHAQGASFTWERCAQQTAAVYRRLIK